MKTKSTVNSAGVYTKPTLRKALFEKIKASSKGGAKRAGTAAGKQFVKQPPAIAKKTAPFTARRVPPDYR
jgi:hypothetical protein